MVEAVAYTLPHRVNLEINTTLKEISKNRGILYDPDVVDTCLRFFDRGLDFL